MNDVTIQQRELLDEDLQNLIGRALCVADALSVDQYIELIESEGFVLQEHSVHTNLLDELVKRAATNASLLLKTGKDDVKATLLQALNIIEKMPHIPNT